MVIIPPALASDADGTKRYGHMAFTLPRRRPKLPSASPRPASRHARSRPV